jgi:phosphatidylglycerophosphate synthase
MPDPKYLLVNGITWWRIVMAPPLIALALLRQEELFKWLLLTSFLTDAVDGKLARYYHVAGKRGARLDSLGDDLTVLAGFTGMLVFHIDFVLREIVSLFLAGALCLVQIAVAIRKYGKLTAFHTVLAKIAAVLQGVFLITFFFWPNQPLFLFYAAVAVTSLELLEETIMVVLIPQWRADVKGLYWYSKQKTNRIPHY